jgi:hypothetical protein
MKVYNILGKMSRETKILHLEAFFRVNDLGTR